ncbi:hypothetical protein [Flavobacterium wongokense]|uniref:hypothetical protein n=1 Tax=Flavobacterium wongokense TaxID=2910674 RepID=UPI001F274D18|nr:hypothetical protein [Flavobacterium sp. WG47]MCF6132380.1 hypothetical protein [Flavobacterium sp. WG47]
MESISKSRAKTKLKSAFIALLLCPMMAFPQSDAVNIIRGGELLFGGLITIFSASKQKNSNSIYIETVCIKNKLEEKITFIISRQTEDGDEIRKELVIPKDGKEYFYELPKGVYIYEVRLANDEIFKKGEYRFAEKSTLIVEGEIIKTPVAVEAEN